MKHKKKSIAAAVATIALACGFTAFGTLPASAVDMAIVRLSTTTAVQSTTSAMSFDDSGGNTFSMDVTTTWQRQSSTQATLRTITITPTSFPRGDCLNLDVGSTAEIDFQSISNLVCPGDVLALSPNVTAQASTGSNLGQLTLSTPDPFNPFGGGARWMYIEYHA